MIGYQYKLDDYVEYIGSVPAFQGVAGQIESRDYHGMLYLRHKGVQYGFLPSEVQLADGPARWTMTDAEFRDALANAYNKGFNDAEEQHDGFTGVSGWTNHNPYSRSTK